MNPEWVDAARYATDAATRALLGDALLLSDEDCRAPTVLPGWTRAHIMTHIAEHASALAYVLEGALAGEVRELFADRDRDGDIEAGAGRTALELLTHIDESAHHLADTYGGFGPDQWDSEIALRGGTRITAGESLRQRLTEVAIHHIDLDVGSGFDDLDPAAADMMIEWIVRRLNSKAQVPDVTLVSETGARFDLGAGGPEVTGPAPRLVGWVAGRLDETGIPGAGGVTVPGL